MNRLRIRFPGILLLTALPALLPVHAADDSPASAAATAPAPAARPGHLPPGQEGRIPFANRRDGIFNWQADGEKGIWVQSPDRQWYYGKFMSPCIGLDFVENRLGFDTEPNGDFDKFSYVLVPGEMHERCQLISLVTSNGPPTAKERKAAKAAAAAAAAAGTTGPAGSRAATAAQ